MDATWRACEANAFGSTAMQSWADDWVCYFCMNLIFYNFYSPLFMTLLCGSPAVARSHRTRRRFLRRELTLLTNVSVQSCDMHH